MGLFDRVAEWFLEDKGLANLTEDQVRACIESLVLCVDVDGHISEEERVHLQRELKRIPWTWKHPTTEVEAIVDEAKKHVESLPDHAAREAHAKKLGERLPHDAAREIIYRMLVFMCSSDGVHPHERQVLAMFRDGLGIEEKKAKSIADEVHRRITGSLE
jgi:uncharacterized tellurite resistance protein B-like protein